MNYHNKWYKSITRQALNGIRYTKAFIHRIRLSSTLTYSELNKIYPGKIHQPNNSKSLAQKQIGGLYNNLGWFHLSTGKRVQIFYNKTKPELPNMLLSFNTPSIKELTELHQKIFLFKESYPATEQYNTKWLIISSIEYTIDFFCRNNTDVGNLFFCLRRDCYFPYSKKTKTTGGYFGGWSHEQDYSKDRHTNSIFYANYGANSLSRLNRCVKIYERGADKDKSKSSQDWLHENCDRVRYELTIKRNILRKHGITNIPDLFPDNRFYDIFFSKKNIFFIQFKSFTERNYKYYCPPTWEQDYYDKENPETFECLQEQIFIAKKNGLDVSRSLDNLTIYRPLQIKIKEAIIKFQKKWEKDCSRSHDILCVQSTYINL